MNAPKLSLEAAAKENYKSIPWGLVGNASFSQVHRNAFIAGAKFREAQLLEIVNQMKAAFETIRIASQKSEESHGLNIFYTAQDTLTSVNKALDEMGLL